MSRVADGGHRPSCRFLSYSANGEDVILNRLFAGQETGFFVDVGAADPLFENDTRALYERGWRGINIEPNRGFFDKLAAERPGDVNLNLAVAEHPGEITFHEVKGTGLSTCSPDEAARAAEKGFEVVEQTVTAATLSAILAEHASGAIDLLKVDVEGLELQVVASNDWDRFRPKVVMVEGTYPESPARRQDGVAAFLADRGYRHVYFDGLNDFYLERDFSPPPEAFDRPPNVFDRFVPLAQHLLEQGSASMAAKIDALKQEREHSQAYVLSLNTELENLRVYSKSLEAARAEHAEHSALQQERAAEDAAALRDELTRAVGDAEARRAEVAARDAELQACRSELETCRAELASLQQQAAAERDAAFHEAALLQARVSSLQNDLKSARAETGAMRDRGSALAAELEQAAMREMLAGRANQAERAARAAELTAVTARLQSHEAASSSVSAESALLSEALSAHSEELRRVSNELSAMLASTSWRITRPMRALARPRRTLGVLLGKSP